MGPKPKRTAIPPPNVSSQQKVRFSFEYYDSSEDKYCLSCWGQTYVKAVLGRLKEINCLSFNELMRQSKVLHFGEVDWSRTIKPDGFTNTEVNKLTPFHFALLGVNGQKARVFGAYSEGVFYIVWFDFEHEIWPTPLKHT